MKLSELEQQFKDCKKCALGQTRTNLVFGVGDENADLVFIGEAPGNHEDLQGEPFVGAAGKLLNQLLGSVGLERSQVYIANILKCRPPNNRDPLPEEVSLCKPLLYKQLEIINPKVIATLGAHATRTILEKNVVISAVRGKRQQVQGFNVFPIFHPAAALYNRTNLKDLEEDFRKLKEIITELPKSAPKQKSLF